MSRDKLVSRIADVLIRSDERWGDYYATENEIGAVLDALAEGARSHGVGAAADFHGITVRHDDSGDLEVYVKVGVYEGQDTNSE